MSSKQLKTFVVNLPKSHERRAFVEPQLKKIPFLDYQFFDAVYGMELPVDQIKSLVHPSVSLEFGTIKETMSPADIGCAESHLKLYELMAKEDIPYMLIMEDDFKLFPTFSDTLSDVIESEVIVSDEPRVVLFTQPHRYYTKALYKTRRFGLFPIFTAKSTACYLINQAAALAMISELRPIHRVADCWAHLTKKGIVNTYSCVPHQVSINYDLESDIEALRAQRIALKKSKKRFSDRFRKLWRQTKFNFFKLWMIGRLKKYTAPDDLYPDQ